MALFDFLRPKAKPGARPKALGQSFRIDNVTSSQELAEFLNTGLVTSAGQQVSVKSSMAVAAVFRSVAIISGVIGGLKIDIKDEETLEIDRNHTLRALLNRRPNSWQTGTDFKKLLTTWTLFRGNGYARKVRVGNRVTALIPVPPTAMTVKQLADGTLEYTHTDKSGERKVYSAEEVFHVRGMTMDGVTGVGVLEYAREAIGLSKAAEHHAAKLFANGTRIGGALKHPEQLSAEAFARLKASLDEFTADQERFGKDIILEEGMDYLPFGMTSADAEFIENRKFSVQEIAMFFGVPPHMLGFTEKQTSFGTGIEQQSIGFVNYTLNDWFEAWEGAIERDLLQDEPNNIADFNPYPLLRGDEKGRWEANQIKLQMGVFNADEVRRDEGLPAKPNDEGQVFYPPPNVATGDQNDA